MVVFNLSGLEWEDLMSRDSYSSYEISEYQRKKLEEERRKRQEEERRRQEEARRREIERRKREEVNAQKNRIAVISKFKERALHTRQNVSHSSTRSYKQASLQSDVTAEMKKIVANIKEKLDHWPEEWQVFLNDPFVETKKIIQEVENNNYDPFYFQRLKWAQKDLGKIFSEAPTIIQEINDEVQQVRLASDELILKLEVVKSQAALESHQHKASTLIRQLGSLIQEKTPRDIIVEYPHLHEKAVQLLEDFDEVQKKDQSRQYVMDNIRDILTGMGYQAVDLDPSMPNAGTLEAGPRYLYFRTPENGGVEIACGLDETMHTEFVNIVEQEPISERRQEKNEEHMYYRCEKWCRDFDYLIKALDERSIKLREKWREPPHPGPYKEINIINKQDKDVSPGYGDSYSKQERREQS